MLLDIARQKVLSKSSPKLKIKILLLKERPMDRFSWNLKI